MQEQHPTDWHAIYRRLTLYAYKRLTYFRIQDMELAQDFASEAITRHFDDDYASWNQNTYPELIHYLGSTVNGLIINWVRRHSNKMEVLDRTGNDWSHDENRVAHHAPTVETTLIQRERTQLVINALREHIKGDALMEAMLELWFDGIDRPAELASRLEVRPQDIYNANKRFKKLYHVLRQTMSHHAPHDDHDLPTLAAHS